MAETRPITATCCVIGGGPAGIMLGLLLARAGIDVVVLEKHGDFLRDFRGDTIHPSTLDLMDQLGELDRFLDLPHEKVSKLSASFDGAVFEVVDLSGLPTKCGYIAFMPQWDFLNFLSAVAEKYPGFRLLMRTEATELIKQNGAVVGVRATAPEGHITIRADLVVAADGRHSTMREQSGLELEDFGAPMDVLWFKARRDPDQPQRPLANFGAGKILILISRGAYWQCGYVIPKGRFDRLKDGPFDPIRDQMAEIAPYLRDSLDELSGWDDMNLLTVQVNRLTKWYQPGFLCIGDAAHAMSPVGGIGINIAIQDAVATANALAGALKQSALSIDHLKAVQDRRAWPAKMTQAIQLQIQGRIISEALFDSGALKPPWPIRLFGKVPFLRKLPSRFIGLGIRREHIETPDILSA